MHHHPMGGYGIGGYGHPDPMNPMNPVMPRHPWEQPPFKPFGCHGVCVPFRPHDEYMRPNNSYSEFNRGYSDGRAIGYAQGFKDGVKEKCGRCTNYSSDQPPPRMLCADCKTCIVWEEDWKPVLDKRRIGDEASVDEAGFATAR